MINRGEKDKFLKIVFARQNKGQITLFVILALIIVSIILLFLLWVKPTYITPGAAEKPSIEGCIENAVKDAVKTIEKQNFGFPGLNFYYMYNGEKIPYLCYTNLYLQPCINQKPFLAQNFKEELIRKSQAGVFSCYDKSIEDLRQKGFEINEGEKELNIELNPEQISIELDAPVFIKDGDSSRGFTKFKTEFKSPIYQLLMVSTYLVQQETKYGDTVIDEPMLLYPNILIDKINRDNGDRVYFVKDKNTNEQIKFATRSIAWPAGLGTESGLLREQ